MGRGVVESVLLVVMMPLMQGRDIVLMDRDTRITLDVIKNIFP